MSNCSTMWLSCWLICSVTPACATTQSRLASPPLNPTPADETEKELAETELPAPPGWGPRYGPRLMRELTGIDEATGLVATVPRGYVLHRIDVEKIRILRARQASCSADLTVCEGRVAELTAIPSFWNRWEGRALLIGLGFVGGVGATVGIALAVGK